jgi:hypothetical protein
MNLRSLLTFFAFFPAIFSFAQKPAVGEPEKTCTIFGTAPGREGNVIGVYQYEDYITSTERKLAETIVGDSGKFSFTIEVNEVTYLFLRSKKSRGFVFAEPGRDVEVIFEERDPKSMVNPNVEYEVPVNVYTEDSTDMNFLASDYNERFYKWWGKHYIYFLAKDSMSLIDTFHVQMQRHYRFVKNPYFMPWMDYGLAAMEDATFHSQVSTARKYLLGKKIHHRNSEYMGFFNSFFQDYLYKWSMRKEGEGISYAINTMVSYDSLLGTMKRLPWLQNDTLRELVMLKGLFELYNSPSFSARNILSIAQQASTRSRVAEHRLIARNIVSFYTKLKRGTPAPTFVTADRKGADFDPLAAYKGKYVYMYFFATSNASSVAELRYMSELQKRYGKKIVFVTVSVDEDTLAYKAFLKANPKYNWTMLHYDFRQKTKEDYNLYSVPAGFIVDPDGNFYLSPADNPSGDLEYTLYRIANPKAPAFVKPGER